MNNISVTPPVDGQAPARRIGVLIAVIVVLCACTCTLGLWYLFAREGLDHLVDSIFLQFNGVTTTGTVSSVEEFSNDDPAFPTSSYKLTVSFEVNGIPYSVKGSAFYPSLQKSWEGESMPIIYDPADPNTALIDTFQERWLEPITRSLP